MTLSGIFGSLRQIGAAVLLVIAGNGIHISGLPTTVKGVFALVGGLIFAIEHRNAPQSSVVIPTVTMAPKVQGTIPVATPPS